jgi:hypothetical protein
MTAQPLMQKLSESIDRIEQLEPPQQLRDFIAKTIQEQDGALERRGCGRRSYFAEVVAVPANKQLQPIHQPFTALSPNISRGGIALLHVGSVRSDCLFLEIEDPNLAPARIVVKVLRSRLAGRSFEIAGRFTADDDGPGKRD